MDQRDYGLYDIGLNWPFNENLPSCIFYRPLCHVCSVYAQKL